MPDNHAKCVTLGSPETDYNFQDLGYGGFFLQKPSASPALNDYLSLTLYCENSKKQTFIWVGRLKFINNSIFS